MEVNLLWHHISYSGGQCLLELSTLHLLRGFGFAQHICSLAHLVLPPEQFVVEKTSWDDLNVSIAGRCKVVRCVVATEQAVKLSWKTITGCVFDLDEEQRETVSMRAYELVEHPKFCSGLCDVIFILGKKHFVAPSDGTNSNVVDEVRSNECGSDSNETWMSCISSVTGFREWNIEVHPACGLTNKFGPNESFRVEKDDASISIIVVPEESVTNLNNDMAELETSLLDQKVKEPGSYELLKVSIPGILKGTFHGYRFYTSCRRIPHALGVNDLDIGNHNRQEVESWHTVISPGIVSDFEESESSDSAKSVELASENADFTSLSSRGDSRHFKQLDLVRGCSDCRFVDGLGKGLVLPQVSRTWLKKVQQEWSILEHGPPETIYIHIYEERMDLLRAAIVGASGTPYHDGLFFFDTYLPPNYPNEPSMVHYHSGGLHLNPNLFVSGKLCLSLLNTWTGSGSDLWNPGSSTILQVLLTLQALVLNDRPYFNKAGYGKHIGRGEEEENSVSYNENVFYALPSKEAIQGLVEEHFLWAFLAYSFSLQGIYGGSSH